MRACPLPLDRYPQVTLAHGGGGRLTRALIEKMFIASFARGASAGQGDAALLPPTSERLAFTTDSFVVHPLAFPGGDIGRLAVWGTCNDLAMAGAEPRWLTVAFVLEEGLPMEQLWRICLSIEAAVVEAGVEVVAGDVKVVERGKGDGMFITTAGIGAIALETAPAPALVRGGDAILINGDVGRHGVAVMAARAEIELANGIESDCANLWPTVAALAAAGVQPRWMRDATRGGLATILVELAEETGRAVEIEEAAVPVAPAAAAVCEVFGLDPLYVANEGRFALVVAADEAAAALAALAAMAPPGVAPARIGHVAAEPGAPIVRARTVVGGVRRLALLSGEQLPRIC